MPLPELAAWGRKHPEAQKIARPTLNKLLGGVQTVALWARKTGMVPEDSAIYNSHNGMISLLVAGRNGDTVETGIVGREGAAGLHSGLGERRSYHRATIQIPGHFAVISAAHFQRAVTHSALLRDLVFHYVETRWAEAQQLAACNAIHSGSARLCRWLLQAADCTGSDHVPLTQEYLADMLGVRRTTVTLLAQELQERRAMRYSRGRITLLDRKMLEACACECYEAIKRENLRIGIKI
jgi:CRP-like cAMP-binding protein